MQKQLLSRRAILLGAGASLVTTSTFAVDQNGAAGFDLGDIGDAISILGTGAGRNGRSEEEAGPNIAAGLRAALEVGTDNAVTRVGQTDGYLADKVIRIGLPESLRDVRTALSLSGQSILLDDLEMRLNRAAENAAPRARAIFVQAIRGMEIKDASAILRGGDTSATDYFEQAMTPDLEKAFHPVVEASLKDAGAMISLNQIMRRYNDLPVPTAFGENAQSELVAYGLDGALAGLFHYVGEEEKRIRTEPSARTSALLRTVFG